jgi:hypothetical protein
MLKAGILYLGGVMVNYRCTAACRHCLYACSPDRDPRYISQDRMEEVAALLREGGCSSVHIGGGEPFLDFQGLLRAIRELQRAGIALEYIETNAFWAEDKKTAREWLGALRAGGVDTLCISLDPYHAEYVPYGLPLALAKLCEETRMGYFLWKQEFLRALSKLPPGQAHRRAVMEGAIGADYIGQTARAYGIRFGGRAVNIEEEYAAQRQSAAALQDGGPCTKLLSTGHFHVDLDGCFIPPGCTGIRLPLAEVVRGIPGGKYPAFEALYGQGLGGLLELAREAGFSEDRGGYPSPCGLCFEARRYLAGRGFAELDPAHYEESLKYYRPRAAFKGEDAPGAFNGKVQV